MSFSAKTTLENLYYFYHMELIIENIKSATDQKLITDLATRLGLKVLAFDAAQQDAALGRAMKKAEKSKMFSKKEALKFLDND